MSDHSKTFVPLETWGYNSPEIRFKGIPIDIGLMAEALIYYDQIIINVSNPQQFAYFLNWFISQDKFADLIALLDDETIIIYDYAFASASIQMPDGSFDFKNIADSIQNQPNTFEQRYLYHPSVDQLLPKSRTRRKLYTVLRDKVIEVKSTEFGASIENAKFDYFKNPQKSALLLQVLLDEIAPIIGLHDLPPVTAKIQRDMEKQTITYNLNIKKIGEMLGRDINFSEAQLFNAAIHCNRILWSSANLGCDIYPGRPMSSLIGDKLYETTYKFTKSKNIIDSLKSEVEFPDIRNLINSGTIKIDDIFMVRKKSSKFRNWLQQESERDRNAIIAYHNEVSEDCGLRKFGKKSLELFGKVGPTVIGAKLAAANPQDSAVILGSATAASFFVQELASKISTTWQPVIFGQWLDTYIKKITEDQK